LDDELDAAILVSTVVRVIAGAGKMFVPESENALGVFITLRF